MFKLIIASFLLLVNVTLSGEKLSWFPDTLGKIENASRLPKEKMFEELDSYLNMKKDADRQHRPMATEQRQIYEKVFNLFATTPGHAEYYAKKLRDAREPVSVPQSYAYDKVYEEVSEILANLPTPETVQVLGRLLEDTTGYVDTGETRGEAAERLIERLREKRQLEEENKPLPDYARNSSPSLLAVDTLRKLAVRGLPVFDTSFETKNSAFHTACREWWQKVKSGQLAFSFPGQLVEYRFKPDGRVESTALPASILEQDPKPPAMRVAPSGEHSPRQPIATPSGQSLDFVKRNWLWVVGGILAMLAGFAWLRPKLSGTN